MNKENLLSRAEMKKVMGGNLPCDGMTRSECYLTSMMEYAEMSNGNPTEDAIMEGVIYNMCQSCSEVRPI